MIFTSAEWWVVLLFRSFPEWGNALWESHQLRMKAVSWFGSSQQESLFFQRLEQTACQCSAPFSGSDWSAVVAWLNSAWNTFYQKVIVKFISVNFWPHAPAAAVAVRGGWSVVSLPSMNGLRWNSRVPSVSKPNNFTDPPSTLSIPLRCFATRRTGSMFLGGQPCV